MNELYVIKRNGENESISFDKVLRRIHNLCHHPSPSLSDLQIDGTIVAQKVCSQIYPGVHTWELDELSAQLCCAMSIQHPDFNVLASRIIISNHQKNTESSFSNVMKSLYQYRHPATNEHYSLISQDLYDISQKYANLINDAIDYERDYLLDYFGFKTLEKSYLLRQNNQIVERPQHLWMRVAICLYGKNIEKVIQCYNELSTKQYCHATPTLFNSGTKNEQLASCFLVAMKNDSIEGIYDTLKQCALISKYAGGIGIHISNIRGHGSLIRGTNGTSNGIVPMLRVFNDTARYVDQCVHPETIIYTTNGPMQIQHVTAGETKIFNLNGEVETVDNVLEHSYEGDFYHIKTMHALTELQITGEHPIYVLRNQQKGVNYNIIQNRLDKNLINFEWVEAKELTTDDMMVYVIPTYAQEVNDLTMDDCYMYGILLGDGCLNNQDKNGYISLHTFNKQHVLDFCKQYFDSKYVPFYIDTDGNCTRIRWNKTIQLPFRYHDVYDNNGIKHMSSKWINLPLEKSQYILKGLLETDGCNHLELTFDTTSINLFENVRFLCLKMGILTSGYVRNRIGESHITNKGKITNQKIAYCLRIPKTIEMCNLMKIDVDNTIHHYVKFFKYQNYLLTRIKSCYVTRYSGTLYDLQMKTAHNYMLHHGLVHNGGGKRNGSIAVYLEPWHVDVFDFLQMKKNHGDEQTKARDLFYALWIPDLFMQRVKDDLDWTLFCPDECIGLTETWGSAFTQLYIDYEQSGRGRRVVKARTLWYAVLETQIETGTPYLLYKDNCNGKSNQQHLGTIKSSNLCTEIIEYSNQHETAVCNLASINLTAIVESSVPTTSTFEIIVYSKPKCSYCLLTKGFLKRHHIKHRIVSFETDEECARWKQRSGLKTFPQIFEKQQADDEEEWIGGYMDLLEKYRPRINYEKLGQITRSLVCNLNQIIDRNYYPSNETKLSNLRHRPIGIGVQGLADLFFMLRLSFDGEEAKRINKELFACIYYNALLASCHLAKERQLQIQKYREQFQWDASQRDATQREQWMTTNLMVDWDIEHQTLFQDQYCGAHTSFINSPAWEGKLQFDLWNQVPSMSFNWTDLKDQIKLYGLRNSLLIAPMPTASTSQILGNYECFEPITSNFYIRRTLAGEFIVINKYLINDLMDLDIWNQDLKDAILLNGGSVSKLNIPDSLKQIYRTVWEISQKSIIDMSADRAIYICQSQSLNLFLANPTMEQLTSMHFYAWEKKLKTGMYYLRTKPKTNAQMFTIDPEKQKSFQTITAPSTSTSSSSTTSTSSSAAVECQSCSA